jgi:RNase P subunit RPR2
MANERFNEDIQECQCIKCLEWWPADKEFFFTNSGHGKLMARCKACYTEDRYPNGRSKQKETVNAN